MDPYHDTHYRLFHVHLHQWLREDFLTPFLTAIRAGNGGGYLVGMWRAVAKNITGNPKLDHSLDLTRNDFSAELLNPVKGITQIFIQTPNIKGPLEAAFVLVNFEDNNPRETLRYFTCEAPANDGDWAPWFIGEWRGRSHSNLGGLINSDPAIFYARILEILGIELEDEPRSDERKNQLTGDRTWTGDPVDLADYAFSRLLEIRDQGGSLLIMNAPKTRGLSGEASSYIQFMWHDEGDLVVEIQGDYSYFGLSIASNRWPILQEAGMQTPVAGAGNFVQVLPASWSHEQFRGRLSQVFRAFIVVLAPVGDIVEVSF